MGWIIGTFCIWVTSQVALVIKNSPANAGRHKRGKFDPEVRKIPWRRIQERKTLWQPIPVFLPGESHDRGTWQATVHGVAKNQIQLSELACRHTYFQDEDFILWEPRLTSLWPKWCLALQMDAEEEDKIRSYYILLSVCLWIDCHLPLNTLRLLLGRDWQLSAAAITNPSMLTPQIRS